MNLRTVRYILWALVICGAGFLLASKVLSPRDDGVALTAAGAGLNIDKPSFTLTDHQGDALDTADFAGQHQLLYFGFTFCPDVCPISTTKMMQAREIYAEKSAAPLQTVFVSIDPERDTPDILTFFKDAMGEDLVTLTGSRAEIDQVKAKYRVYAEKRALGEEDDNYLYDHSDLIYWIAPDGTVRFFTARQSAEEIATTLANYNANT